MYNYSSLLHYLDNNKARENRKQHNSTRNLKLEVVVLEMKIHSVSDGKHGVHTTELRSQGI